jgi:hypothetical protein
MLRVIPHRKEATVSGERPMDKPVLEDTAHDA